MMFRKELEKKANEIRLVTNVNVEVTRDKDQVHVIYNDNIFKGTVSDCYNFLEGFLAASRHSKNEEVVGYASE